MPKIVDRDLYRKELLSKCFDLFAQRGYGSLTMRQIAKEIGVSTGTIYHYFSSKEDLFVQLIEQITEQDILSANAEIENQHLETIEEKILALGQFIIKNEDYFRKQTLLYINFIQQPDLEQGQLVEAVKHSYKRYREEFMKSLDLEDIAIANHISGSIDGFLLQQIYTPELVDFEEQINLLARILARYLDN